MDYQALSTLIQTNPQWPTVTDVDLLTWVQEETVNVDKTSLPNATVLAVILTNRADFTALSANDQQIVRDILYIGDSVPTTAGEPARDTLVEIFGGASLTIQTLAAEISKLVSRAVAAGIIGSIRLGDIEHARTI